MACWINPGLIMVVEQDVHVLRDIAKSDNLNFPPISERKYIIRLPDFRPRPSS